MIVINLSEKIKCIQMIFLRTLSRKCVELLIHEPCKTEISMGSPPPGLLIVKTAVKNRYVYYIQALLRTPVGI